jgi:hypothetical protein
MRGMDGVVRVARLRIAARGRAHASFRVPSVPAGYYTPAIGCLACANRSLILGGEHSVAAGRKDVLRIIGSR